MSVQSELSKLGSGTGLIYLTDADGVLSGQEFPNTTRGREIAERLMIVSSPVTSSISATATVNITAAGGTITNLTYNAVSVFDTASPITGATTADQATNLANAINGYVSTPEYTASASGSVVTVYLDPSQGSLLNGSTGVIAVTATTTGTTTDLDGGVDPADLVDSQIGYRMFVNASSSAPSLDLTGATDITTGVIRKSASTPFTQEEVTISSGVISPARDGNITVISVETEGAIAADDLENVETGIFTDGDILILRGVDVARVVTVKEGGNIELANNGDFLSGSKDNVICLQFFNDGTPTWFETFRSPGIVLSVANLRSSGIAEPIQGVDTQAIVLGGSSTTLTAGTDKGFLALTGTGTLTGSVSYSLAAGLVDGDTFTIDYNGVITLGGFTITLMGVALTTTQALEGNIVAQGVWDAANTNWIVSFFRDTQLVDLADDNDLALKEDYLDLPAGNGYVLVSTTAGVRTWVANSTDIVLDANSGTVSSGAGVETTLRTITIPANTLSTSASAIMVDAYGEVGANINIKNIKVYFDGNLIGENIYTLTPNGVGFKISMMVQSAGSTIVKCGMSMDIAGGVGEAGFAQVGSLNLTTTSYDITITGQGAGASDVNVYESMATKLIA
ncbi:hypothetical protein N9924_00030 [bacterium]|nr:hypothetical protein [bacterium]